MTVWTGIGRQLPLGVIYYVSRYYIVNNPCCYRSRIFGGSLPGTCSRHRSQHSWVNCRPAICAETTSVATDPARPAGSGWLLPGLGRSAACHAEKCCLPCVCARGCVCVGACVCMGVWVCASFAAAAHVLSRKPWAGSENGPTMKPDSMVLLLHGDICHH